MIDIALTAVPCERCGVLGNRRRGFVAPEGWYFGAFTHDSEGDHMPGDFLIGHSSVLPRNVRISPDDV